MTNEDKSWLWFSMPYILMILGVFGFAFYVSIWVGLILCSSIGFLAFCTYMSEHYDNKANLEDDSE